MIDTAPAHRNFIMLCPPLLADFNTTISPCYHSSDDRVQPAVTDCLSAKHVKAVAKSIGIDDIPRLVGERCCLLTNEDIPAGTYGAAVPVQVRRAGPRCRSISVTFVLCRVPYRTSYRERACQYGFLSFGQFCSEFYKVRPTFPGDPPLSSAIADDPPLSFALLINIQRE